ncbi:MAG: hypothetical protein SGILL_008967 [Bacillariaceae sp.]
MRFRRSSILAASWLLLLSFSSISWSLMSSREVPTRRIQRYHSNKLFNTALDDDKDNNSADPTVYDGDIAFPSIATQDQSSSDFVILREEDEENTCLPPGRKPETKLIFLVSDATGVTARSTLLKSLAQYDSCSEDYMDDGPVVDLAEDDDNSADFGGKCVRTRCFTFIRSPQALQQILKTATAKQACVMYTLADPELRQLAGEYCASNNIHHVDMMGPSLDVLSEFLDKEPLGIPSRLSPRTKRRSYLGDQYYSRINAVEFTLKADDGQSPWLLPEADIVLVGVSRSGKTPLSVVLSQTMSLKVANIPLVMEVPPPTQLLEQVDPRRIFCLTIAPSELRKIRTSRMERRGIKAMEEKYDTKSNYADRSYLLKDLASARKLSDEHGWAEVDVTGRAVEETATLIMELFSERFLSSSGVDGDDDDDDSSFSSISNQHIG